MTNNDPLSLLEYYQAGVALGIVILSTLILFPGRESPSPTEDATSASTNEQRCNDVKRKQHHNHHHDDDDDEHYWTPHRRLNAIVYALMMLGLFILWLQAYPTESQYYLIAYLQSYWPREVSTVLGWGKQNHH